MPAEAGFAALLRKVRDGDPRAAEELVRLYEPQIRRVVRVRLTDARLRQQIDSLDVCQSVMGEFFFRAALGQFDLNDPGELVSLLARMVRNKLINQHKHHRAARRDIARQVPIDGDSSPPADTEETPSEIVARREILETCRRLLSQEEFQLAEARAEGRGWDELAAERGVSPDALRKRHVRALDRVAAVLGLKQTD